MKKSKKKPSSKKRMTQSDLREKATHLVNQEIPYLLTSSEFRDALDNYRDCYWDEEATVRATVSDFLDMNEEFFDHLQKIVETVKELKAVKAKLRS
jgi:sugar-specific transcriptional regulator TrmB